MNFKNIRTWFEIYILRRSCLNCKTVEILDKPTRYMEKYFCENAINPSIGLVEPEKTSTCNKFKRKKWRKGL